MNGFAVKLFLTGKKMSFLSNVLFYQCLTLDLMGGGGVDSIQLFKEIFSQTKLDIFRGV